MHRCSRKLKSVVVSKICNWSETGSRACC